MIRTYTQTYIHAYALTYIHVTRTMSMTLISNTDDTNIYACMHVYMRPQQQCSAGSNSISNTYVCIDYT